MILDIETYPDLLAERPIEGMSAVSAIAVLKLDDSTNRDLLDLLSESPDYQFARVAALEAEIDINGQLLPRDFATDTETIRYKQSVGWKPSIEVGVDYHKKMLHLAREVGTQLSTLLVNLEFHDVEQKPSVAVVIEHTRKHEDRLGTPAEDNIITLISGTTNLAENVPPNQFGPHLDFSHSSPAFILFAANNSGTISCLGEYPYLDATRSQSELNIAGNGLARVQLEEQKLYFGDVRTLLHEAPNTGDEKWRNFIRLFVGPRYPRHP